MHGISDCLAVDMQIGMTISSQIVGSSYIGVGGHGTKFNYDL